MKRARCFAGRKEVSHGIFPLKKEFTPIYTRSKCTGTIMVELHFNVLLVGRDFDTVQISPDRCVGSFVKIIVIPAAHATSL